MKSIKLDSILVFALTIPFIMTYQLSPFDTPYWLFGLIFLSIVGYISLDVININERMYFNLKHKLLWAIIILVIGSSFTSAIVARHKTSPLYMIHDIVLQQEAAIRFFLDGKNPYAVTYFGTLMEKWNYSTTEVNPALYHFVMEPFYLLFAIPFYAFSLSIFGFFDGRIPLYVLFFITLLIGDRFIKDKEKKLLFFEREAWLFDSSEFYTPEIGVDILCKYEFSARSNF